MREYMQSKLWDGVSNPPRGNCWQTAVACILEVDPTNMPDQVDCAVAGHSYASVLSAYLAKHHRLGEHLVCAPEMSVLIVPDHVWHVMSGRTLRTTDTNGWMTHAVVGRGGKFVWDPHPSRAGLVQLNHIRLLLPCQEQPNYWPLEDARFRATGEKACYCSACGGIPPKQEQELAPQPLRVVRIHNRSTRQKIELRMPGWMDGEIEVLHGARAWRISSRPTA